jgi:hypothetical protein
MTELEFSEIVASVCNYPRVYTVNGTFTEVTIFLEGYAIGANVGKSIAHSKFTPFLKWLVTRLNSSSDIVGWDEFRNNFPDDITV